MIRKVNSQNPIYKKQLNKLVKKGYVVVKMEGPNYICEKVNSVQQPIQPVAPKLSAKAKMKLRRKAKNKR